jgi:hypothetical protein
VSLFPPTFILGHGKSPSTISRSIASARDTEPPFAARVTRRGPHGAARVGAHPRGRADAALAGYAIRAEDAEKQEAAIARENARRCLETAEARAAQKRARKELRREQRQAAKVPR